MKLKKLILATTLAIPAMGYCGLMGWITGYPEVKEKLTQRLTEKYNGDKFEIQSLDYVSNAGYYNFEAKDVTKDITGEGSYFPKNGAIAANTFKWDMLSRDLEKALKPYISQVSDNYDLYGKFSSVGPETLGSVTKEMKYVNDTLGYMYEDGVDVEDWMKKHHETVNTGIVLKIQSKRDPESMYKVMKMIYEINNYFQSFDLGEYSLDIQTFDVPKDLDIAKWYEVKYEAKSSSVNPYKDLYKYAWGYLKITSCPDNPKWGKSCNYEYQIYKKAKTKRDTVGEWLPSKEKQAKLYADKIHSIQDVSKYLKIYDNYGEPTIEKIIGQSGRKYVHEYWQARYGRATTPLNKTKKYSVIAKLINIKK